MLQRIGKINKSHGVKGDIIITHNIIIPAKKIDWDAFMIELQPNSFIPFFIEEIRIANDKELICKFEEINSREKVNELLNKNVYASPNFSVIQQTDNYNNLVNFEIYNNEEKIGKICSILSHGKIELFEVAYQDKEILIPAQKELILKIDEENNIVYMNLPEGLLDL